ncbi:MAG: twin-arginine translocation signal domain-containing protein [Polyangiaceae bacterium]|nr:twin-arginine translocation signal domain-containing protein [Polyangiaceae bacterium]
MRITDRSAPNRRDFLRAAAAAAGGYTLTRIFAPRTAWAAYREKEVKFAAKLTGRLTFDGTVPKPVMKDVTSDHNVAGKDPRIWEGLNIGKNKGLKDSLIVVNGVLEGKKLEPKPALTYAQGAFILPRIEIFGWKEGTKLELENKDPILHSWQVYFKSEVKDNRAHPSRMPNLLFDIGDPGLYEFRCAPHAWERAFRWAVPHPYFARTDEDGHFEIDGLPEGDYTVDIWSEGLRVKRLWMPVHDDKLTIERAFGGDDLSAALKGK